MKSQRFVAVQRLVAVLFCGTSKPCSAGLRPELVASDEKVENIECKDVVLHDSR